MRNECKTLVGSPEGRDQLGNVGVDGNIILKWILKSYEGVECFRLVQGRVQWWIFVKRVMNPRDLIKVGEGEFLDHLSYSQLIKKNYVWRH